MQITIDVPDHIANRILETVDNLPTAAKEALAIEAYRSLKLSLGETAQMLGKGSIETLDWLGRHGIEMNYSLKDLEEDRKTAEFLFDREVEPTVGKKQ